MASRLVSLVVVVGVAAIGIKFCSDAVQSKNEKRAGELRADEEQEARIHAAAASADKGAAPMQLPARVVHLNSIINKNRPTANVAIGATVPGNAAEGTAEIEGTRFTIRYKSGLATELQVSPVGFRYSRDRGTLMRWLGLDPGSKVNGRAIRVEPHPDGLTLVDVEDAVRAEKAAKAKIEEQKTVVEARRAFVDYMNKFIELHAREEGIPWTDTTIATRGIEAEILVITLFVDCSRASLDMIVNADPIAVLQPTLHFASIECTNRGGKTWTVNYDAKGHRK